ncbi:MAG TPA: sigma-70 family RNA polymerase sigma factor [Thermomicrobiales bacterium]|nr:sigma-70 family RNA polymerase sigma factor [Thermomicrobiales bacterium]
MSRSPPSPRILFGDHAFTTTGGMARKGWAVFTTTLRAKLTGREDAGEADDSQLVAQAKADPDKFALLYARYFDTVYRYCLRRLRHPETAADTTAQIFTRAFTALPHYHDRSGSFRRWLFTIAHNAVIDAARRRKPVAPLDDSRQVIDPSQSPEEYVVALETQRQLTALLDRLTPDQREVVNLRLAGLTGVEIASVLGKSLTAIKSTQFRAYNHLRTLLIDAGFDPSE